MPSSCGSNAAESGFEAGWLSPEHTPRCHGRTKEPRPEAGMAEHLDCANPSWESGRRQKQTPAPDASPRDLRGGEDGFQLEREGRFWEATFQP